MRFSVTHHFRRLRHLCEDLLLEWSSNGDVREDLLIISLAVLSSFQIPNP